jgi:flagellar basal-body rod modification protein FlgD
MSGIQFPVDPYDGAKHFGQKPAEPKSDLYMETFLRLLTVQLVNQNPLEPMNDRDFFAQMAQLGQVEGMDNMQDSLESTQAGNLIGKGVVAVRPMTNGATGEASLITGTVREISYRNGEMYLKVDEGTGEMVDIQTDNIQQVFEVQAPKMFIQDDQAMMLLGKRVTADVFVRDGNGQIRTDQDGNPVLEEMTGSIRKMELSGGERKLFLEPESAPGTLVEITVPQIKMVEA